MRAANMFSPIGVSPAPYDDFSGTTPKVIVVEEEEVSDSSAVGRRVLLQRIELHENGSETWSYREDGSLSYRDVVDYAARECETYDQEGRLIAREVVVSSSADVEEVEITNVTTGHKETTTTRRDAAGRVVESIIDSSDGRIRFSIEYDGIHELHRPGLTSMGSLAWRCTSFTTTSKMAF